MHWSVSISNEIYLLLQWTLKTIGSRFLYCWLFYKIKTANLPDKLTSINVCNILRYHCQLKNFLTIINMIAYTKVMSVSRPPWARDIHLCPKPLFFKMCQGINFSLFIRKCMFGYVQIHKIFLIGWIIKRCFEFFEKPTKGE